VGLLVVAILKWSVVRQPEIANAVRNQVRGKASFTYTAGTFFTNLQGTVGGVQKVELVRWAGRVRVGVKLRDMFRRCM